MSFRSKSDPGSRIEDLRNQRRKMPIEVWVYPLKVTRCFASWPEMGQRTLKWCTSGEAIALLGEEAFGDAIR